MHEHHITVARTARYYTIGNAAAREVWIACHGYSQLARYFLRSFQSIDDGSRLVVAPEALNRYYFDTAPGEHGADARVGATWMTREDREHEIADYIAYLDAVHQQVLRDNAQVIAFGFSQGTATISRWAARTNADIAAVILWAGSIARDLEPAALRGRRVIFALGENDPQISATLIESEQERLRRANVAYQLFRYEGGHRLEAAALQRLAAQLRPPG